MSSGSILGIALFVAMMAFWWWQGSNKIPSAEARKLVAGGAKLLDVRTSGEFGSGHLAGALNIPVDVLAGRLAELGDKDVPVVVYCRSGARSARASQILTAAGFHSVADLGGMHRW